MTVESNNVKSIFLDASEKPTAERAAFLEQAVGDDPQLRMRVEALLKAHDNPVSFLENPIAEFGASIDLSPGEPPLAERPGTVIGPYKLVQQIGEGGMGVVFMAEQSKPIQRTVAIKIIKAGMDTRQVIARFEAERQALAMMDHSNIARVLDAGTTESGRPYFVMDLVKGAPITEYCDQQQLPIRQRLELMVAVCQAVQHAHQKGIIHRDLKPSNVLVADYDGRPVPKIIDFGVAKATAQKLTERTLFTQYGQIVGTFEYMSPEQARFNQFDVDTRSDIYSLGVLLYELLAGSTPLEKHRLRFAAFDEILRLISEEEPPQPSTRLSRSGLPNWSEPAQTPADLAGPTELAAVAANRQIEPAKLKKLLRGELDWIVMKALEKDRNRRYEMAAALAADLMHYLADEPVTAAARSRVYRLNKFVRRNRGPVVAACLIAAAIVAGVAASAWQAIRATRAERAALTERDAKELALHQAMASADAERAAKEQEAAERKKAENISSFLISAFNVPNPDHNIWAVTEVLQHSAQEFQNAYPDDPVATAGLLATMGRAYAGLRRFNEAEQMYRKCLEVANEPGMIDRLRRELATCLLRVGKSEEGVAILREFYLEELRLAENPAAKELLKFWSGLPEAAANAHGNPGMDGLELDGDRDYVILPRLFFDGRPPWTLEVIVWPLEIDPSNPTNGPPYGWTSLISAADGGAIALESLRQRWTIELYAARVPGPDWTDNYAMASARTEVELRRWQHVAGVWDGKELRLYLDGKLQSTRSEAEYCSSLSLSPIFLGADPANPSKGVISEGNLYGRLRAVRISRGVEYIDSFAPPERLDNTSTTIGLYDFTINCGQYAMDSSGHGNHGIIIGAKYAKADQQK